METVRFELRPDGCCYHCSESGDNSDYYVLKKDHDDEVARLKAELAEVREFWESTANAFASEVADCTELREAVAWYVQCESLWMESLRLDGYSFIARVEFMETIKKAFSELKRLAGVK